MILGQVFLGVGPTPIDRSALLLDLPNTMSLEKLLNWHQEPIAERIIQVVSKEMEAAMEIEIKVTLLSLKGEEYYNRWGKIKKRQTIPYHLPYHTIWDGTREVTVIGTTLCLDTPFRSVDIHDL